MRAARECLAARKDSLTYIVMSGSKRHSTAGLAKRSVQFRPWSPWVTLERFVREQDLNHYRRLLAEASVMDDVVRHRLLLKLLADEEEKGGSLPAARMIDPPL